MRAFQVILFSLGAAAFMAALPLATVALGEILWRVGVGVMLVELAIVKLWPTAPSRGT